MARPVRDNPPTKPTKLTPVKRPKPAWTAIVICLILAAALGSYGVISLGFALPDEGYALPENASAMPDDASAITEEGYALSEQAAQLLAQHTASQDYQVCLKPNDFYAEPCQPKDRQYLANLTDQIHLDFGYRLSTDVNLDYTYHYQITGKLVVYDKDDKAKEIFSKNYDLLNQQSGQQRATKSLDITETYVLDYQTYNSYAAVFKSQNELSGEAVLIVEMKIDLTAELGSREIQRTKDLSFTIPLTKQTYNIKIGTQPDKDDILQFVAEESNPYQFYKTIATAVGVVALLLAAGLLLKRHLNTPKSLCDRYDAKIHREYGRIIVDLKTPLRAKDYKHHYEVKDFEDLIDKADRVMQNILFFTVPSGRNFYAVVEGESVYLHGCPYWELEHPKSSPTKIKVKEHPVAGNDYIDHLTKREREELEENGGCGA